MKTLLVLIFLSTQFIYSQEDKYERTSIIEIIANKEKFNKKEVSVKGYLVIEFENIALYLSREDYRHKIWKNAIYVYVGYEFLEKQTFPKNWTGEGYVEIKGMYSTTFNGTWDFYSGCFLGVKELNFIEPRE